MKEFRFFSNRLRVLAERLGKRLFNSETKPFERRLVIVPSSAMKDFLANTFASHPDYAIFSGVRTMLLAEGFIELLTLLKPEEHLRIPSSIELSLRIEQLIGGAIGMRGSLPSEEAELLQPLFDYLYRAPSSLEKRIGSLSSHLSLLFSRYGLYGDSFLDRWSQEKGWQQWIWTKVYGEGSGWTYPIRALSFPLKRTVSQIHLFGFSSLPQVYREFFDRIGTTSYFLSPCAMYWEDVSSDRERIGSRRFLEKKNILSRDLEKWEDYVRDTNPLLANWGKVGRDFFKGLDTENSLSEECYVEPIANTGLGQLQCDLLLLQNPRERARYLKGDDSIQVHSASSLLREVEILYHQLCNLIALKRQSDEPLEPKEILVLAPDLDLYAPFIPAVFGAKESILSYSLEGIADPEAKEFFDGILHLLSLPEAGFSSEAVLELFTFSAFREKWQLSWEDVATIRRWVKKANIRLNGWDKGFDRLVLGTMMELDEEAVLDIESERWPCRAVEMTQTELFGKLIELIRSLREDLKPVVERQTQSISHWLTWVEEITRRYFELSDELEPLLAEVVKLRSHFPLDDPPVLTLSAITRALTALAGAPSQTLQTHHAQKITFRSLKSGHLTDAKVICLLGMDEESFPRKEPNSSLCAMRMNQVDKSVPKKSDEDRYLFLECVTLAQEYLMVSYQRFDPRDNKEKSPSSCVQELSDQITICHHPAHSFDRLYFSQSHDRNPPDLASFSQRDFQCAQALYGPKRGEQPFFPHRDNAHLHSKERVIDLRDLGQLAQHPIRFHFQKALEMDIRSPDEQEGDFLLSHLSRSILRKRALKGSVQARIKMWKEEGKIPVGVFGEAAIDAFEEEVVDLNKHLSTFGILPEQIFSIELSPLCKEAHLQHANKWVLPAFSLSMPDGSLVHLVGEIENVTPKGLLFHGEDKLEDWVKCWPALLIIHCLIDLPFPIERQLLLTKKGKMKKCELMDAFSLLQCYIGYYDQAFHFLSPLMPSWIESFFSDSPHDLEKAINQSITAAQIEDPYLLWLKRRHALPDPQEAHLLWGAYAQELFASLVKLGKKEEIDAIV